MDTPDLGTLALMLAALVTGVGTACVSLYRSFREAKHEADRRDDELVANKLIVAEIRIADLERELTRWRGTGDAGNR